MERDRFRIFREFRSHVEPGVLEDIENFLGAEEAVGEYQAEVDEENQIRVRMTLKKFSFLAARDIFCRLSEFMRRSYYNVYTSEETEEGVRYLYLTGMAGWDGVKMEVLIE